MPGSASEDKPDSKTNPANNGATLFTPPKSAMNLEPRRLIKKPTTINKAPVEKPWLTMYKVAPLKP